MSHGCPSRQNRYAPWAELEEESRQQYATRQVQALHRRLVEVGHPPTFGQLLAFFRQFGKLYDLGYRTEQQDQAA